MTTPRALKRKIHVDRRVEALGHRFQVQSARLVGNAKDRCRDELAGGSYAGGGDTSKPRVTGGGRKVHVDADEHGDAEDIPVTSVEAAAIRAERTRDRQRDIEDQIDGIAIAMTHLDRTCRHIIGPDSDVPEFCDGNARQYQGHKLPWTEHSRDPRNGWQDPTCRDIAHKHGLCERCLVRMNRWRLRNELAPIGIGEEA